MHESVLLNEVLQIFENVPLHTFIDGTLGAGGHSAALLAAHPEIKIFYGLDQDPEALAIAKKRLAFPKCRCLHANFVDIATLAPEADGILLDLGVSSMQLDRGEKGFSFMREGPLDMRMNPDEPLTAREIVNTWSEEALGHLLRDYGEEKRWKRGARAIVEARGLKPIETTLELSHLLEAPLHDYKSKIHPATRAFQALRIAVNRELERLECFLPQALRLLRPKGRLAIITFHSLEDRIVKHFFRSAASDKHSTSGLSGLFLDKTPEVLLLTPKPLKASDREVAQNPRSRSAKLRAIEKLG